MHEESAMRGALFAVLLLAAAGPARADFSDGQASFLHDDFASARIAWEAAAEQGDARAQYGLGVLHWRGLGVAADPRQAVRWFASAARQGYRPAFAALAAIAAELQEASPRPSGYGV
jgi:TPR repeat protein